MKSRTTRAGEDCHITSGRPAGWRTTFQWCERDRLGSHIRFIGEVTTAALVRRASTNDQTYEMANQSYIKRQVQNQDNNYINSLDQNSACNRSSNVKLWMGTLSGFLNNHMHNQTEQPNMGGGVQGMFSPATKGVRRASVPIVKNTDLQQGSGDYQGSI